MVMTRRPDRPVPASGLVQLAVAAFWGVAGRFAVLAAGQGWFQAPRPGRLRHPRE
jgi:hypothetical protein